MRRILAIAVALIMSASCSLAQKAHIKNLPNYDLKTWHFGFTVGMNNLGFRVANADDFYDQSGIYGVDAVKYTGFHLGPLSNLRLTNHLDLRMMFNLSFNQRDLVFHRLDMKGEQKVMNEYTMSINSTMLEFPVQIKYKAERMTNFAPYVIMGANFRYDLSGECKPADDNSISLKKIDPCVEWGVGFDCYLPYFKLAVELKYGLGLMETLDPNGKEFANSIKSLKSNSWTISLHFE
ncbi:MAG: PorT family protein [Bacteroidales bacterium]|nr:PorT family protein [Bacteroidales bacterium]